MAFYYVYILNSVSYPGKHYTGFTKNLGARLRAHNAGQSTSTRKYRPWRLDTAFAFRSKERAVAFERYLKSHSGRAFAVKHF